MAHQLFEKAPSGPDPGPTPEIEGKEKSKLSVAQLLASAKLSQYEASFDDAGVKSVEVLLKVDLEELRERIRPPLKSGHFMRLKREVCNLKKKRGEKLARDKKQAQQVAEETKQELKQGEGNDAETGDVSEIGLNPAQIELIVLQVGCDRASAVNALREHNNDIVNAVLSLSP